jgi:hypothetical protein
MKSHFWSFYFNCTKKIYFLILHASPTSTPHQMCAATQVIHQNSSDGTEVADMVRGIGAHLHDYKSYEKIMI